MTNITQINFKKAPRSFEFLGRCLYREQRSGSFYERVYVEGKRTWRKLAATTERQARNELGARRTDKERAKQGLARDPYKRNDAATIGELAEFYLQSGCPQRNEAGRAGKQLKEEERHVSHILQFFGKRPWASVTLEDCRQYHRWRVPRMKRAGGGDRMVDIELRCLSSVLRWAQKNPKRTGVTANPIAHERTRFSRPESVRHCRELMPESGAELHAIAKYLFNSPASEVLGWQALAEAMIGGRTSEILKLRWDAKDEQCPGYIQGKCLFLFRSRTTKGTYPYCEIFPELRDFLQALRAWRDKRFPNSPWFFPSPRLGGVQPVQPDALTKALQRICPAMGLPPRTSHGLRSFWVNVMRSFKKVDGSPTFSDGEIALRAGHRSGGRLIVQVYGEILPYQLTWLPETGEPAWADL